MFRRIWIAPGFFKTEDGSSLKISLVLKIKINELRKRRCRKRLFHVNESRVKNFTFGRISRKIWTGNEGLRKKKNKRVLKLICLCVSPASSKKDVNCNSSFSNSFLRNFNHVPLIPFLPSPLTKRRGAIENRRRDKAAKNSLKECAQFHYVLFVFHIVLEENEKKKANINELNERST